MIEAFILLLTAIILLRFAGKKSVAKMTNLETVIILAIGTTMGHAIKEHRFWQVILILIFFVLFLYLFQKLQLKSSKLERYLIGEATLVIHNGKIIRKNLNKLRITEGQLEMRLRQKGISYVSDIKTGTIESDGDFGYELMPQAKPVTQEELLKILNKQEAPNQSKGENIFEQVVRNNK
jgi:uncharacterized membrane protein YcaP (DUF421 family)